MIDESREIPAESLFAGFVCGQAIGDALGLPREGLSPRRASRMFGGRPLHHRFVCGRGMVSDDTEHMWETALTLVDHPNDAEGFSKSLARRLRWWLARLPAGVGMATAKSLMRSWLGWKPDRSGVFSAGNGPAMRAGVIGLCLAHDLDLMRDYVHRSTRITHTDPRAESGAMMIALAARQIVLQRRAITKHDDFLMACQRESNHPDWDRALIAIGESLESRENAEQFAQRLGIQRGVSGYIVHTVAAVLFCLLRWPGEFRGPVEEIILMGGDTDTTAAILGGLAGASSGVGAIPEEWRERMMEFPRTEKWQLRLARQLMLKSSPVCNENVDDVASKRDVSLPHKSGLPSVFRNVFFLGVVLCHGLRRMFPPY